MTGNHAYLQFVAEGMAREEYRHFKEVIFPARLREVEAELTALIQEWAPGCEIKWVEDNEV